MPIQQFSATSIHDENKLYFNDMMMMSSLYSTNTLLFTFFLLC